MSIRRLYDLVAGGEEIIRYQWCIEILSDLIMVICWAMFGTRKRLFVKGREHVCDSGEPGSDSQGAGS